MRRQRMDTPPVSWQRQHGSPSTGVFWEKGEGCPKQGIWSSSSCLPIHPGSGTAPWLYYWENHISLLCSPCGGNFSPGLQDELWLSWKQGMMPRGGTVYEFVVREECPGMGFHQLLWTVCSNISHRYLSSLALLLEEKSQRQKSWTGK